jgi:hypothetical protein
MKITCSTIITKPATISKELLQNALQNLVEEQKQVIVHCQYTASNNFDGIRIWQSTFLFDNASSHASKLLHAENISIAPDWTILMANDTHNFTLIFTALPNECTSFNFAETIPEPGGFLVERIPRNKQDIYHITIN